MALITAEQHARLRMLNFHFEAWINTIRHPRSGWASYKPEEVPPHLVGMTNEDRSDIELYEWHASPPDRYFAYYKFDQQQIEGWSSERGHVAGLVDLPRGRITNFMGVELGTFRLGKRWTDNFGGRRFSFRMEGTNACAYTGFGVLDTGNYVRIKRVIGR